MDWLLASYNVCAMYSFVPLIQIQSGKNHDNDHFPFLKIQLSFVFLALKISNRDQWESKLPHDILLLKRPTIASENRPLKKNHPQNKNENVVDIFCDTDPRS